MKKSIYATVMGEEFARLHPKVQERFGLHSDSQQRAIGYGVMDQVWHGNFFILPFLLVGSWRNIMFPESGRDVPFTIENWAYVDSLGRETVTELRTFKLGRARRFDAYMVRDPSRNIVVDYMGTHQHLAVDLHLSVAENGGLIIESGEQRFYEGPLAFVFPSFFTGKAFVYVWFDETINQYRVEMEVRNKFWGTLFGFTGKFDMAWEEVDLNNIPPSVKPLREEPRY